jgi:RNA polymerase sigma factor (TIGR02999 family)
MGDSGEDVTTLLNRWGCGDRDALDELVPVVYNELRNLAPSHLRREPVNGTLQPTSLVHEVYLHLLGQRRVQFNNRAHFFGAAAQIIRRILVDRARERQAAKRGGGAERVDLEDALAVGVPQNVNLIELDRALTNLEDFDAQKARVVELRYFAGLSIPETAEVLSLSPTTIKREWSIARAWLYDRLGGAAPVA